MPAAPQKILDDGERLAPGMADPDKTDEVPEVVEQAAGDDRMQKGLPGVQDSSDYGMELY